MLEKIEACQEAIDWAERNCLIGYESNKLHLIKGDFKGYVAWIKDVFDNSTFDERGNQTSYKDSDLNNCSWKKTFDERGNQTSYEDSQEFWWKRTFNNDVCLTYKDSSGFDWNQHTKSLYEQVFDKHGNQTVLKEKSKGIIWEQTFDERNNCLAYKHADGSFSFEQTFDEQNNQLTYKSSDYSWKQTFDKQNNCLTKKTSYGYLYEKTFDKQNNLLTSKLSRSNSFILQENFDKNGGLLKYKHCNGTDDVYQYKRSITEFKIIKNNEVILTIPLNI